MTDPAAIELLSFLKILGQPGAWLVAAYLAWRYVAKDIVSAHVAMSENAKVAALSAERAASSHMAGSTSAESTVAMAKEIITIAKATIDSARNRG